MSTEPLPAQAQAARTQAPGRSGLGQAMEYVKGGARNTFNFTGAAILLSIGYSAYKSWRLFKDYVTLPQEFFLNLDFENKVLVERVTFDPAQLLSGGPQQVAIKKLTEVLDAAKNDGRVKGLMAVLGGRENFQGMAQIQAMRNAVTDFKAAARDRAPALAYTNVFGEGGSNGTALYYLASAFDGVYMPPTGCVSFLGVEATQLFVRRLLDRLKVIPRVFRREEYKTALNPVINEAYDDAQKENLTSILQDVSDQVIEGVAKARLLTREEVEKAMNDAPLTPEQGLKYNLLDGIKYRDEVERIILRKFSDYKEPPPEPSTIVTSDVETGEPVPLEPPPPPKGGTKFPGPRVSLTRYHAAQMYERAGGLMKGMGVTGQQNPQLSDPADFAKSKRPGAAAPKPAVVIVHASGQIVQKATQPANDPLQKVKFIESMKYAPALRKMREHPQVKAVVLSVNSPGGSAVASDVIARELQLLRQCGKPVVVVMGDVAASGGYYISAPANKILAQPATLTGSIGVIMAKFNVRQLAEDYGITVDTVKIGENADWASPFHDLTPKQFDQLDRLTDDVYEDFLQVVAKGRNIPLIDVRKVAKGRVWTGRQAQQVGLVDELGGLPRGIELAKQLANLSPKEEDTLVVEWPPTLVPPLLALMQSFGATPRPDTPDEVTMTLGASLFNAFIRYMWSDHPDNCDNSAAGGGAVDYLQCQSLSGGLIAAVGGSTPPQERLMLLAALLSAGAASGGGNPYKLMLQQQGPMMISTQAEALAHCC